MGTREITSEEKQLAAAMLERARGAMKAFESYDQRAVDRLCQAVAWATANEVTATRLAEMGVRIGSRLRVLQSGSPCLLQVGESRLSLRGDWATQILVRPVVS